MQIARSRAAGHTVLRPVGKLATATSPALRFDLRAALADGDPVVMDLALLTVAEPSAVEVFATTLQAAGGWPGAALVLFGPDAATARLLSAASVPAYVPVVDTLAAALARTARRPEVVRRSVPLGADLAGVDAVVRTARTAVQEVCDAWALRSLCRASAAAVAAELVANAVTHAGGPTALGLEHNHGRLWLRVRDGSPDLPMREPGTARSRGLDVVGRLASGWGTTPHPDGKTVWAWLPAEAAPTPDPTPEPVVTPGAGGPR